MEEEQAAGAEPQAESAMPESFSRLWTDVMGILVSALVEGAGRDWAMGLDGWREVGQKWRSLGGEADGFDTLK